MKEKKDDIPAPTEDDNERRRRRQVDDTHTTAHASPPLQRSRCILNASSGVLTNRYICKIYYTYMRVDLHAHAGTHTHTHILW